MFKNIKGNIIYVGKAKDLKKRVTSYFTKNDHDPKTSVMISHISSIDFILTNNETEALILENNLIKKNTPKYNINLKDSKRYSYILLTDDNFPRLMISRDQIKKGIYFGPFISAQFRDNIIYLLNRNFKLRTCNKFPKKACLRYHLDLCSAPCINNISQEDYNKNIKKIISVLKGNTKELLENIEIQMKNESKKTNYEKAMELKNQIDAIKYLNEKQNMERNKQYDEDIINYIIKDNRVYLILFNISKGILDKKHEFEFDYSEDFFEEFLVQYYSDNPVPKEIIIPSNISQLKEFLELKRNSKTILTIPEKGEKKHLLDLVIKNIELSFFGEDSKLEELKNILNLEVPPRVIECFDISHLSGTSQVGSMVQFRNGKPDKTNYRRFKIKSINQIDDFAAIKEIVFRRYYRIKKESTPLPNLIIIDGGKGQLSSAISSLKELDLKIPIISIAKEFEEIYTPGESDPIKLDQKNKALLLIRAIRDEAHRFAITYNRLLRKKKAFE